MWPFSKKTNLSGFKIDSQGNMTLELTDEENQAVKKAFDRKKGYVVHPEMADEIQRARTAQALFDYATHQIMLSDFALNQGEKKEFIEKAIASISKAYCICPLPIYIYDLACFMEMNNKFEEAKNIFTNFLALQKSFKPSQIQEILLAAQQRDVDEAIKDAKEKIK